MIEIREAKEADAAGLLAIYAPYVAHNNQPLHLNMKYRRWRNLPSGSGRRKQSIHILLPNGMERCLGMRMPGSFMPEKRMHGRLRHPSM